jgi:hypothetical protein
MLWLACAGSVMMMMMMMMMNAQHTDAGHQLLVAVFFAFTVCALIL